MRQPLLLYSGPRQFEVDVRSEVEPNLRVEWVAPEREAVEEGLLRAAAFLDASMKVPLTARAIEQASELRIVATATTGADHIDQAALDDRRIPLLTLSGQHEVLRGLTPAAEHSFLLVLACARRLRAAQAHVMAGGWNRVEFPGIMLKGRTLALVGCGRIGAWMARYGTAFGMRVIGFDPHLDTWPDSIERVSWDRLADEADVVSVHVPLTAETSGMVNREFLDRVRPGCILINTSRGDVIDEAALLWALRNGRIAAAGLDVLSGEPEVTTSPLWEYSLDHDNLLITPHIGGFSLDAVRTTVVFTARRILEALAPTRP